MGGLQENSTAYDLDNGPSFLIETYETLASAMRAHREARGPLPKPDQEGERRFSNSLPGPLKLSLHEAALIRRMLQNHLKGLPLSEIKHRDEDGIQRGDEDESLMSIAEDDLRLALSTDTPERIDAVLQSVQDEFRKLAA